MGSEEIIEDLARLEKLCRMAKEDMIEAADPIKQVMALSVVGVACDSMDAFLEDCRATRE